MSKALRQRMVSSHQFPKFMNKPLLSLLAIVIAFAAIHYGYRIFFSKESIRHLESIALSATEPNEQEQASLKLANRGKKALPALKRILQESSNENVIAICMNALAEMQDGDCMDIILENLDSDSKHLRTHAARSIKNILGRDYNFPVDGSARDRDAVKQQIVDDWNSYKGSELHKLNKERFER